MSQFFNTNSIRELRFELDCHIQQRFCTVACLPRPLAWGKKEKAK